MTVDEAVRNLGKAIQNDCRYKRYIAAKKANDENDALQNQIGEFQLLRMNFQRDAEKSEQASEKLTKMEETLQKMYDAIISTDGMKEFQAAKDEVDSMMNDVDAIISLSLSGEDPETCHTTGEGCGGNCANCSAGCH
jgi:cell fate (sporulation/competence/biofilm development) regulator YlbF (YheA/YmcA/DUF963 family)